MIELSVFWTTLLNFLFWPAVQMSIAYFSFRVPTHRFHPEAWIYAPRAFESRDFYERGLRIRRWKSLLPDGAAFFSGAFSKKRLSSHRRDYLDAFVKETCRGEWAHWAAIACFPMCALWNPPWAVGAMFIFAVVTNLPCIFVQRYNRFALKKILKNESFR